jgi:diadenosine tetraphosphate (Ap4A) HIT family hydrolase
MAFLDIAPLAEGHLLLCPRAHRERLTSLEDSEARELGRWLRIMSKALMRAVGVDDWNVVQNNGAAAAQVVPHAHFHIIPRPDIRRQGRWSERFTMFGRGKRTDLDEEEGVQLAEKVRSSLSQVLREEKASDEVSRL